MESDIAYSHIWSLLGLGADSTNSSIKFGIVAGWEQTCAWMVGHNLKCWGQTLGYGDQIDRGDTGDDMGDALPPVDSGHGCSSKRVVAGFISKHTCALLDDDTVKCWGVDAEGVVFLGYGDTKIRGDTPEKNGDSLVNSGPWLRPQSAGVPPRLFQNERNERNEK